MTQFNRCMGCMEEKGEAKKCQHCGWVEDTAPDSPLFLLPRTVLQEKYLLGRVLGQGGFGITYLAWDLNLNVKLAIKEYFPQDLATRAAGHSQVSAYTGTMGSQYEYGLDKFLQEARTLAQFDGHPNIVSVRDFFKANGTAYFVMNYVEGITLKEHLASAGGKLPVEQALAIILPVLDALKEVHAVNVLHRDISPDNIFINRKGQIILLDFGAARQAIGEKGHSLSIILKPGYAPEEQYRSKGVQGPWTDIYAVAATFYHLITGTPPPEALERLVDVNLVPPSQLGVEIGKNEEEALIKALAVRAPDRHQTIEEFQEALLGKETVPEGSHMTTSAATGKPSAEEWYLNRDGAKSGPYSWEQMQKMAADGNIITGDLVQKTDMAFWLKASEVKGLFPSVPLPPQTPRQATPRPKSRAGLVIGLSAVLFLLVGLGVLLGRAVDRPAGSGEEIAPNIAGNTGGNIANGGLAALQGDWIYYINDNDYQLYKIRTDGSRSTRVHYNHARLLNVVGDWIYYSNLSVAGNKLYKVRTDGSEHTQINDDHPLYLIVVGDWIYYSNNNDDLKIYKVQTDGSGRTRLNDDKSVGLDIAGDWIYYRNNDDGGKIYKIRTDGSERTRLNDHSSAHINVAGDWIYYRNHADGGKIYKLRTDGSEIFKLNDDESLDLSLAGEWLYYINVDGGGTIYKIRTDGSERTRLNDDASRRLNIAGDWIYYNNEDDTSMMLGKRYRIRTDGSERQVIN